MNTQHVDIVVDAAAPPRSGFVRTWWMALPPALRAPRWQAALAAGVILALLLGFVQVVRGAVQQGEALRMTAASRADAVWRCNSLPRERMRARCLARIDLPQTTSSDATHPPNTAVLVAGGADG